MDAEGFKLIRLEKGMSQKRFAEYIGISESTVRAIETGHRPISAKVRACIAKTVEIDKASLYFFDAYKKLKT